MRMDPASTQESQPPIGVLTPAGAPSWRFKAVVDGVAFRRDYSFGPTGHILVLLLLPFICLSISTNWIFSPPGSIDPWVYVGFFLHYADYQTQFFPNTYYGSRLAWVVPGHLAHTLLPPFYASVILHLVVYYTAIFSLYSVLRAAANQRVAIVSTILMGTYSYFLSSAGWDYVDGAGIAYFLLTAALLTRAALHAARGWGFFFSGLALGGVLFTNIFSVTLLPSLGFYYLAANQIAGRKIAPRMISHDLLRIISGVTFVATLLSLVNWMIGGSVWFYGPSFNYALGNVDELNPWKSPTYEWVWRAKWLVFPAVVMAGSLISLARSRRRAEVSCMSPQFLYPLAFLLHLLILIACEIKGMSPLQHDHYASYLIPTMFLCLGSLFVGAFDRLPRVHFALLLGGACLMSSLPLWGSPSPAIQSLQDRYFSLVPFLWGLCAVALLQFARRYRWAGVICVVGLCASHYTVNPNKYASSARYAQRDAFVRITSGASAIESVAQSKLLPRFWYSDRDPAVMEFTAIHSIYLWGYTGVGFDFPEIKTELLQPGMLLVIPSSTGSDISQQANASLQPQGLAVDLVRRAEISHRGVSYSLWLFHVRSAPGPAVSADGHDAVIGSLL